MFDFGVFPYADDGFNLGSLAGLTLELNANLGTYIESTLTTPAVSDGDPVGGWVNQVAGASDALQATTTNKFTLRTEVLGAYSVVESDGVNDILAGTSLGISGTSGFTCFLVTKLLVDTAGSDRIFGFGNGAVAGELRDFDAGGDPGYRFDNANRLFNETLGTANFNVLTFYCDDGAQVNEHEMRINSVQSTEKSVASPTSVPDMTDDSYVIGTGIGALGSSFSNMQYAHIGFYTRLLSTAEMILVENYLTKLWGL